MESLTVVPSPTGDADSNPCTDSSRGGPNAANPPNQPTRDNPPASRTGYLRERYKECQLSEEATSLVATVLMETEVLQVLRLPLWQMGQLVW